MPPTISPGMKRRQIVAIISVDVPDELPDDRLLRSIVVESAPCGNDRAPVDVRDVEVLEVQDEHDHRN